MDATSEAGFQWGRHRIDIEKCELCGGHFKVVWCIDDPKVIEKILQHLALKESPPLPHVNEVRGPPDQAALF